MRKFVIWGIILAIVLGVAGFCIYWFIFRDTSSGGQLTHKETLFVIEQIGEQAGIDFDAYVQNRKKTSFVSNEQITLNAEGESDFLYQEFANSLVETPSLDTAMFNLNSCKKQIVFAWKILYDAVYQNKYFKQGKWFSQDFGEEGDWQYRIKINSLPDKSVVINYMDKSGSKLIASEILIKYNFRLADRNFNLLEKTVSKEITNDNENFYSYLYASVANDLITVCEFASFNSTNLYRGCSQKISSYDDTMASYVEQEKTHKSFVFTSVEKDEQKQILKDFIINKKNINFSLQEIDKSVKIFKTTAFENFCA